MARREPWLNILLFLSRPFTRYSAFTSTWDMIKKCHRGNRASSGRVVDARVGRGHNSEPGRGGGGGGGGRPLNQASCLPPFNLVRTTTVKVDTDMNIFEVYGVSRPCKRETQFCPSSNHERARQLASSFD